HLPWSVTVKTHCFDDGWGRTAKMRTESLEGIRAAASFALHSSSDKPARRTKKTGALMRGAGSIVPFWPGV
ncbi:MAG: hypothetical protein ACN6OD_06705, partial [Alcaligenes sp.]